MPHSASSLSDLYTRIVYSMDERNVMSVWVDGERLVHRGKVRNLDADQVVSDARREISRLVTRLD
jgi:cytosine/adenosine deaminase-related metal-dependent hydrolase